MNPKYRIFTSKEKVSVNQGEHPSSLKKDLLQVRNENIRLRNHLLTKDSEISILKSQITKIKPEVESPQKKLEKSELEENDLKAEINKFKVSKKANIYTNNEYEFNKNTINKSRNFLGDFNELNFKSFGNHINKNIQGNANRSGYVNTEDLNVYKEKYNELKKEIETLENHQIVNTINKRNSFSMIKKYYSTNFIDNNTNVDNTGILEKSATLLEEKTKNNQQKNIYPQKLVKTTIDSNKNSSKKFVFGSELRNDLLTKNLRLFSILNGFEQQQKANFYKKQVKKELPNVENSISNNENNNFQKANYIINKQNLVPRLPKLGYSNSPAFCELVNSQNHADCQGKVINNSTNTNTVENSKSTKNLNSDAINSASQETCQTTSQGKLRYENTTTIEDNNNNNNSKVIFNEKATFKENKGNYSITPSNFKEKDKLNQTTNSEFSKISNNFNAANFAVDLDKDTDLLSNFQKTRTMTGNQNYNNQNNYGADYFKKAYVYLKEENSRLYKLIKETNSKLGELNSKYIKLYNENSALKQESNSKIESLTKSLECALSNFQKLQKSIIDENKILMKSQLSREHQQRK